MSAEPRQQRFVFGEAAELYDQARPGYGAAIVDDVLDFAGVDAERLRALEVGAGTGKATVAFATREVGILALEPDPAMAAVAARNCAPFPRVSIERATFEEWRVQLAAFDLLFAAQAWHWVDPSVRYIKAAQALRASGTLALIWHRVRWRGERLRDELEALYRRVAPELYARDPGFPGLSPRREERELIGEITASGLFDGVTARTHRWSETFTAESLVDRLSTQSDHRLLDEATRVQLFDALRELVTAHGGAVVVPHVTFVALARRR
jgi:SAM-dependent methyltransferase